MIRGGWGTRGWRTDRLMRGYFWNVREVRKKYIKRLITGNVGVTDYCEEENPRKSTDHVAGWLRKWVGCCLFFYLFVFIFRSPTQPPRPRPRQGPTMRNQGDDIENDNLRSSVITDVIFFFFFTGSAYSTYMLIVFGLRCSLHRLSKTKLFEA